MSGFDVRTLILTVAYLSGSATVYCPMIESLDSPATLRMAPDGMVSVYSSPTVQSDSMCHRRLLSVSRRSLTVRFLGVSSPPVRLEVSVTDSESNSTSVECHVEILQRIDLALGRQLVGKRIGLFRLDPLFACFQCLFTLLFQAFALLLLLFGLDLAP